MKKNLKPKWNGNIAAVLRKATPAQREQARREHVSRQEACQRLGVDDAPSYNTILFEIVASKGVDLINPSYTLDQLCEGISFRKYHQYDSPRQL